MAVYDIDTQVALDFFTALGVGFLVGFQRENSYDDPGEEHSMGVRTFTLIGVLGFLVSYLERMAGVGWLIPTGVIVLGTFLGFSYFRESEGKAVGMTTEISALVVFFCGVLAQVGNLALAVLIGVMTTVVLSAKGRLHLWAHRVRDIDMKASLKFAVMTAVVLPVLPNETFGPEGLVIFNPFKIWLLVVLISGISFVGFILMKVVGAGKGLGLTGLMGGLASSTAVTLSLAERSRKEKNYGNLFAFAILIAWTVMFIRVPAEIWAINPALARSSWVILLPPAIMGCAWGLVLFFLKKKGGEDEGISINNPFELSSAIKFGLLFVVIMSISHILSANFGTKGVYISSLLAGLADADAIALTVADMHARGNLSETASLTAVLIAAASNTLGKSMIVFFSAGKSLRKSLFPALLVILLGSFISYFFIIL